jgi:hypothetical protein
VRWFDQEQRMKNDHGLNSKVASQIALLTSCCILALLAVWLLPTTGAGPAWAVASPGLSSPAADHAIWLPLVFRDRLACSDPYEPNNSSSTAPLIGAGSAISVTLRANFCGGDPDDIYRIDAQVTTTSTLVVALLDVPEDTDLDLYLYDARLALVAGSNSGGNGADELIAYDQMDTGSYFIRVYPFRTPPSGDTRWYTLRIRLSSP